MARLIDEALAADRKGQARPPGEADAAAARNPTTSDEPDAEDT